MAEPQGQNQINIKATEEDLKGRYANLMQVSHPSKDEFLLDFFLVSGRQGSLASRLIVSPAHAKRILGALQENIGKYEERFGTIEEGQDPQSSVGFQG